MTRDGLVEENLATGSKSNISSQVKGVDFTKNEERLSLNEKQIIPEADQKNSKTLKRQNYKENQSNNEPQQDQKQDKSTNQVDSLQKHESYDQKEPKESDKNVEKSNDLQKTRQKNAQYRKQHVHNKNPHVKEKQEKTNKLQFKKSEVAEPIPDGLVRGHSDASKKIISLDKKASITGKKLEHAKKKIPKKHSLKTEHYFDEVNGKARKRIYFEESEKPLKNVSTVKQGIRRFHAQNMNYTHRRISEVEKENTGVEATHKSEQALESVLQHRSNRTLKKRQELKGKVRKFEQKSRRINTKLQYQKFREGNPDKFKSSLRNKLFQKQRIKKEYQKVYRNGKSGVAVTQKTLEATTKMIKKLIEMMIRFRSIILIAALIGLLLIIIVASFSACTAMFTNLVSTIIYSSWISDPIEIDNAEMSFTYMEAELQDTINHVEIDHPGYDEYRYNLGAIGHNPFELISYLSALYEVFTLDMVLIEMDSLFGEMYTFTTSQIVEIRTRTETQTIYTIDPDSGNVTEEVVEVEVEYEYYILDIQLTTVPFSNLVTTRLNTEQLDLYSAYMETNGGLQQLGTPFPLNWYPYISSYYGYRIGPTSGELELHRGLDIALPEGTEIHATHTGTVITVDYDSSYGNYVVIADDMGFTTKYAHLYSVSVSEGQTMTIGDVIGGVGTTGNSTGNHLHIEVLYYDLYFNPIFFLNVGEGSL